MQICFVFNTEKDVLRDSESLETSTQSWCHHKPWVHIYIKGVPTDSHALYIANKCTAP